MRLAKTGQICNVCQPNALMTLMEYLEDYAAEETKEIGSRVIAEEIEKIENQKIRQSTKEYIAAIRQGKRDFRF